MADVVYLHGKPDPVGHFLRVGGTGHRQLENLLGAGRMLLDRVVMDASAVTRQHDLLTSLSETGAELILDTNVAELSSVGRFAGAVRTAPWANPKAVLSPEDFRPTANRDVVRQIARFAISHKFHAILAPTHVLENSTDYLFRLDRESTSSLRRALDAEGGAHVGIDYSLTIKSASLRDSVQRRALIAGLADVPFDNLWLRVSGFGADATPMGLRRYIAAALDFLRLDRPIISDETGGLVGLAVVAFGAAGGICHGVAEKERFDASDWGKPPKDGGGGRERRLLISGLDRLLTMKQVNELMNAPSARKLLSCEDPNCCTRGFDDMVKNPKAHYLRQRFKQVTALSAVPESRRASHFLEKDLATAERTARQATKLKVSDASLAQVLSRSSERLERMHAVLEALKTTIADAPRSTAPKRRKGTSSSAARGGR